MNEQLKNIQDFFKSNSMFKNLIWINIIVFVLVQVTFVIPRMFNENAFFLEYISQNENAGYYVSKLVKYILSTTADFGALIMRPWSIFTYMFTHMEVGHILSNLIFFFFFGKYLHQFLGDKKLLSTYILGGLAGWLLYALGFNFLPALTENGDSYMIGASASVMACVVAAATYAPNMKINLIIFQLEFKYLAAF